MKVLPFKIPKTSQESFRLQIDHQPYFYDYLHQHPEVQITYIVESEGKAIIGDHIGSFAPGDLYVIGPNLPHVFRNDASYYDGLAGKKAHAISIFFEWQSFGDKFLSLPEVKSVSEFSRLSGRGLMIHEPARSYVVKLMRKLFKTSEMERLIVLLEILRLLSETTGMKMLTASGVYNDFNEEDGKRLDAVYRFTMSQFSRRITLHEVAAIANMTVNSFCRYFKRRTRKSYIDFLTEVRIGQACKLLQHDDRSISQVCFEVGFNNLSNFNRKFKELNDCTPSEFRRYQEKALID